MHSPLNPNCPICRQPGQSDGGGRLSRGSSPGGGETVIVIPLSSGSISHRQTRSQRRRLDGFHREMASAGLLPSAHPRHKTVSQNRRGKLTSNTRSRLANAAIIPTLLPATVCEVTPQYATLDGVADGLAPWIRGQGRVKAPHGGSPGQRHGPPLALVTLRQRSALLHCHVVLRSSAENSSPPRVFLGRSRQSVIRSPACPDSLME
jgi:hypothetical protein